MSGEGQRERERERKKILSKFHSAKSLIQGLIPEPSGHDLKLKSRIDA